MIVFFCDFCDKELLNKQEISECRQNGHTVLDYPDNVVYRKSDIYPWTIFFNEIAEWKLLSK